MAVHLSESTDQCLEMCLCHQTDWTFYRYTIAKHTHNCNCKTEHYVKLYVNLVKIVIQFTVGKVLSIHVVLRGLFEDAQYNSEAGATRAVNSRARTK